MARSYYVIELSARWLTVLLVVLAVLMALAFGLGYAAAWSMFGERPAPGVRPTPTPLVTTEIIPEPTVIEAPATSTPAPATATAPPAPTTRAPVTPSATAVPPTPAPATATPRPRPRATEAAGGAFWVQVLASAHRGTIDDARSRLAGLGFDRDHQRVVVSEVVGGEELFKLRVGPFPDRASADRVVSRMRAADFPDAWVVVP
jgi:cell division septation protein DedD